MLALTILGNEMIPYMKQISCYKRIPWFVFT